MAGLRFAASSRRRHKTFMPAHRPEIVAGMKFGSLTVVACVGAMFSGRSAQMSWRCRCDQCRRRFIVAGGSQLHGGRSPCGCLIISRSAPSAPERRVLPAPRRPIAWD